MAKKPVKRKATSQLTPHNQEDFEDAEAHEESVDAKRTRRRATTTKIDVPDDEGLKGVFGNLNNHTTAVPSNGMNKMAGLNRCFYKSLAKVICKRSDKDLRYLFEQYNSHVKAIEEEEAKGNVAANNIEEVNEVKKD